MLMPSIFLHHSPLYVLFGLSRWAWSILVWLGELASKPQGSSCLCLPGGCWDYRCALSHQGHYFMLMMGFSCSHIKFISDWAVFQALCVSSQTWWMSGPWKLLCEAEIWRLLSEIRPPCPSSQLKCLNSALHLDSAHPFQITRSLPTVSMQIFRDMLWMLVLRTEKCMNTRLLSLLS